MFSFVRRPAEREENSSFYRMRTCKKSRLGEVSTERKRRKRIIKGGIRRKSKTNERTASNTTKKAKSKQCNLPVALLPLRKEEGKSQRRQFDRFPKAKRVDTALAQREDESRIVTWLNCVTLKSSNENQKPISSRFLLIWAKFSVFFSLSLVSPRICAGHGRV